MQDSLGIHMRELNWEGFECVSFWYEVFDTCLEFIVCKCCARNSLKFIIAQGCLQQVAQFIVPMCLQIATVVPPNALNFVSQYLLQSSLFV